MVDYQTIWVNQIRSTQITKSSLTLLAWWKQVYEGWSEQGYKKKLIKAVLNPQLAFSQHGGLAKCIWGAKRKRTPYMGWLKPVHKKNHRRCLKSSNDTMLVWWTKIKTGVSRLIGAGPQKNSLNTLEELNLYETFIYFYCVLSVRNFLPSFCPSNSWRSALECLVWILLWA